MPLASAVHLRQCRATPSERVQGGLAYPAAALAIHVGIIVGNGSQKQMLWIYAWWIIASMEHAQTVWDWTYVQFP